MTVELQRLGTVKNLIRLPGSQQGVSRSKANHGYLSPSWLTPKELTPRLVLQIISLS